MLDKDIVERLLEPLDPSRVAKRSGGGGMQLSYLKSHDVIDRANMIFGFGAWGYETVKNELCPVTNEAGETIGQYFAATIKLTVVGCVPVVDQGTCAIQNARNPRAQADAFDLARKGAVSDGLKRCLRVFGNQFGLSLYSGDDSLDTATQHPAPSNNGRSDARNSPPPAPNQPNVSYPGAESHPPIRCDKCGTESLWRSGISEKTGKAYAGWRCQNRECAAFLWASDTEIERAVAGARS